MTGIKFKESSFIDIYQAELNKNQWQSDSAQLKIVEALSALQQRLAPPSKGLMRLFTKAKPVSGIYLWGGVGRGKTWLIDLFISQRNAVDVQRYHYHQFIALSQDALSRYQGMTNPLDHLAKDMVQQGRLIFIDEFTVKDISDAMLIAGLLQALIKEGAVLCLTSNLMPDDLYKGGLQRDRFLPAIDLLKQNSSVIEISGETDFRTQEVKSFVSYPILLGEKAEQKLLLEFDELTRLQCQSNRAFEIMGRDVEIRRKSDDVIWFDFSVICGQHRSQRDYLELGKVFHTVFISDVMAFDGNNDDVARRFILMVDEFYDRRVKLVMNIAEPLATLYTGERLAFEFKRTQSRLIEMQSEHYRNQSHRV